MYFEDWNQFIRHIEHQGVTWCRVHSLQGEPVAAYNAETTGHLIEQLNMFKAYASGKYRFKFKPTKTSQRDTIITVEADTYDRESVPINGPGKGGVSPGHIEQIRREARQEAARELELKELREKIEKSDQVTYRISRIIETVVARFLPADVPLQGAPSNRDQALSDIVTYLSENFTDAEIIRLCEKLPGFKDTIKSMI